MDTGAFLKSAGFTGRSDNKVDAKGRINIPAAFKRLLAPVENDEVVILHVSAHLLLFNKDYWAATIQQTIMDKADIIGKEQVWKAIHRLSENSHMSVVDSQGRITIPAWLLAKAQIQKDVLIIGAFDRVSVWSPGNYEKWVGKTDIDSTIADLGLY